MEAQKTWGSAHCLLFWQQYLCMKPGLLNSETVGRQLCSTLVSPQLVWPQWLEGAGTTWFGFGSLLDSSVLLSHWLQLESPHELSPLICTWFSWYHSLLPAPFSTLLAWLPHSRVASGSWTSCPAAGLPQARGYKSLQGFLQSGLKSHRLSQLPYSVDQANHWSQFRLKRREIGFYLSGRSSKEFYLFHLPHPYLVRGRMGTWSPDLLTFKILAPPPRPQIALPLLHPLCDGHRVPPYKQGWVTK